MRVLRSGIFCPICQRGLCARECSRFRGLATSSAFAADIGFRVGSAKDGLPPPCSFHIIGDIAPGDGEVFRTNVLKAFRQPAACRLGSLFFRAEAPSKLPSILASR